MRDLRNRCLNPGKYAQHLERWLTYYLPQQLHIIDGEQLKSNPVEVMNELQRFLKISPVVDYATHLRYSKSSLYAKGAHYILGLKTLFFIFRYDPKKGFFCQVINGDHTKCLGRSKGRQYPAMEEKSMKLLQRYYLSHNTALLKLLKRIGIRNVPQWLKTDLSDTTTS